MTSVIFSADQCTLATNSASEVVNNSWRKVLSSQPISAIALTGLAFLSTRRSSLPIRVEISVTSIGRLWLHVCDF